MDKKLESLRKYLVKLLNENKELSENNEYFKGKADAYEVALNCIDITFKKNDEEE